MRLRQEDVRRLAEEAGFTLGGVAAVPAADSAQSAEERQRFEQWIAAGSAGEMEYLKRRNESGDLLRSSVRAVFPWAKSVIVCAANYNGAAVRSLDPTSSDRGWIARYAWSGQPGSEDGQLRPSDYHKVLLKRLNGMEARLREECGAEFESRAFVDTGPIVERVYARYAGLGWTGKNTCLISQGKGSWHFLCVLLTSLEVEEEQLAVMAPDRCGSCTRCIDACPTDALTPYRMDASRCIAYLTIEKRGVIEAGDGAVDLREGIGRNVFGCDICQEVCPWNRKALPADDTELTTRQELVNPALDWLAAMTEADFGAWFYGSPVKRAKYEGFRRNLAIAMGNSRRQEYAMILRVWAQEEDAGLRSAAEWALQKLQAEIHTAS
ncbi:tRNA epoxyqueuosine(34) reductase QueG [Silvibacterium dinghuense]|uniref:tRNA epoxyqueuosine(34) reductase QueG n=1 Tax=Silvibacterium dinghuense TaxID=1560006 RepID=A0A4Q1S8U0_9BACT|nr:tRNA epoxyqueuosine(34) reductase QueG [Silvibacterium dinghuense]RXS93030.1 tRNA epoxyqueuosine(34) reductase QueG [Silvibacterium dinghuense]GGG90037.1 epoxyqueuosine reductase [Silvibacterium dinghuense]